MNLVTTGIISAAALTGALTMVTPNAGATSQASCTDGSVRSNLRVTWVSSKNVTVGTVGNKPLCEDVTIYFSSYTMPDNYNGRPFNNNPTATPQTIFDNTTVVLKKGAVKPTAMAIKLPEACKNIQVDVYHGPKIDTVDTKGHGKQYISGKILPKTQNTCTPVAPEAPVTPAIPEAPVTPAVPVSEAQTPETLAPQVAVLEMPAELPRTGLSAFSLGALGSVLTVTTYAVAYVIGKRN